MPRRSAAVITASEQNFTRVPSAEEVAYLVTRFRREYHLDPRSSGLRPLNLLTAARNEARRCSESNTYANANIIIFVRRCIIALSLAHMWTAGVVSASLYKNERGQIEMLVNRALNAEWVDEGIFLEAFRRAFTILHQRVGRDDHIIRRMDIYWGGSHLVYSAVFPSDVNLTSAMAAGEIIRLGTFGLTLS